MNALNPDYALFLGLLRQARPGITAEQAATNGDAYLKALAEAGLDAAYIAHYDGHALVVHLDRHGKPQGCRRMPTGHARTYVAAHPKSVIVASWKAQP